MLYFHSLLADIEAQVSVQAHVLVRHPDQGKAADHVSAPIVKQEFVARDGKKKGGHIMAEAVLAGKDEEKFTDKEMRIVFALFGTPLARLTKDLFVCHRPGDAGNRDRQQEQPHNLQVKRHLHKRCFQPAVPMYNPRFEQRRQSSYSQSNATIFMCNPVQPAYSPSKGPVLLYYITDRAQFSGNATERQKKLLERITQCALAGVDYIQLREKDLTTRELEQLAQKAMAAIPDHSSTRLLINSRLDVALACGAHGVHLPANYLSASEARAIFAQAGCAHPIIGVSAHSAAEVARAESHGADFAVFGPVFEKAGRRNPGGLEQLAEAARGSMPVLALGGISLQSAGDCLQAGAAGIAGIRMFQQGDVSATVNTLRRLQAARTSAGR